MWSVFGILLLISVLNAEPKDENLSWDEFVSQAKLGTKTIMRSLQPHLLRSLSSANVTGACERSLLTYFMSLHKLKAWAVFMADASGKIPSGILDGTVMDFGSYDECLKIRVNASSDVKKEAFRGRYCMVGYQSPLMSPIYQKTASGHSYVEAYGYPPEWMSNIIYQSGGYLKRVAFWFGTCVPSTCTKDDVLKLASVISNPLGFNVSVTTCETDEPFVWPSYSLVVVCVLSCLGALCVLGSLLDILKRWLSKNASEEAERSTRILVE